MIVKNEAASIKGIIESCVGACDHFTIYDTGSTDGTQKIVLDCKDILPGELYEGEFGDFATARNKVMDLEAARPDAAVFNLMLSGDEYLVEGAKLREHLESKRDQLEADAFTIKVRVNHAPEYYAKGRFEEDCYQARVLRTGSDWRYEGAVHEYPVNRVAKQLEPPGGLLEDVRIDHNVSDEEGRQRSIHKHLPILQAMLEKDPTNSRTMLLLAQTEEAISESTDKLKPGSEYLSHVMAAIGYYMRAVELGNFPDIQSHNMMRVFELANSCGLLTAEETVKKFDLVLKTNPNHVEVLFAKATMMIYFAKVFDVIDVAKNILTVIDKKQTEKSLILFAPSIKWRTWMLLASCYRQLWKREAKGVEDKMKQKQWRKLLADAVEAGIAAGGPEDEFNKLLT